MGTTEWEEEQKYTESAEISDEPGSDSPSHSTSFIFESPDSTCYSCTKTLLLHFLKRFAVSTDHEEFLLIGIIIYPIWFLANCLYKYSLLLTSVGSSTIIR